MTEENIDEARESRHALIQKEFRSILTSNKEIAFSLRTDGIVVLSGPNVVRENGEINVASPENILRIGLGVELVRQITARKSEKDIDKLTERDILNYAPPLVLNGEAEQLPVMKEIAERFGLPGTKIQLVDAGKRGQANTKTQLEAIAISPQFKNAQHLTFVTSDYHIPRVVRTATATLNPDIDFEIISAPYLRKNPDDVFRLVRGEVRRIETYSKKGDITTTYKNRNTK